MALKEDQRARLLEACLQLAVEDGPRAFSAKRLAAEIEMSDSSFFRSFHSLEDVLEDFWQWCWEQLNRYLAEAAYEDDDPPADAVGKLQRHFDYLWRLYDDERMRGIAFLCFAYYRRAKQLAPQLGTLHAEDKFVKRVERLCQQAIEQRGSTVSPLFLRVWVMNWCAATLMTWQFLGLDSEDFTPAHVRLGFKNMVDDVVTGELTPERG
jgi:AcrR family transcriptional regulator